MKRILSLLLVSLMLLTMLASCDNKALNTDTEASKETNTDTSTNTNTDTSTDTGTDTRTDPANYTATVNSLEATYKNITYYYEPLVLGTYLGENVPRSNSTGFYKDFDFGWYYQVIKSYEELSTLVEKPENVDASVFAEGCILLVSYYNNTTSCYMVEGFRDLTYDWNENKLSITADGVFAGGVGEAETVYNLFLVIPNSSEAYNQLAKLDYGILDFNFNEYKRYEEDHRNIEKNKLEEGSALAFDKLSDLDTFLKSIDSEMKVPFKYDTEYENDYFFIVTYSEKCSFCTNYIGYKNFHTDGENVYITLQRLDSHSSGCFGEDLKLNIICVNKYAMGQEAIYGSLSQNPNTIVLVEEIIGKFLTDYSLIEISELYRYEQIYIE